MWQVIHELQREALLRKALGEGLIQMHVWIESGCTESARE